MVVIIKLSMNVSRYYECANGENYKIFSINKYSIKLTTYKSEIPDTMVITR